MAPFAVIDVGTNSTKLHVARVVTVGTEVLADVVEVTRLGEGLHESNELTPSAMARTAETIREFASRARALGAKEIVAVGTMALRTARNSSAFRDRVRRACGVELEVLDGEEEARLSWRAATSGLGSSGGHTLVFDAGGGSTELVWGDADGIDRRESLDVGCRRPTEQFLKSDPVTALELDALLRFLEAQFARPWGRADRVLGVGGTVTTLGAVMRQMEPYDPESIQGLVLPRAEVRRQLETYRSLSIAERRRISGLPPNRADVILAGAAIVLVLLRAVRAESLTISERGLRHGVFADRFGNRGSGAAGTS